MARLKKNKFYTEGKPIEVMALPAIVYIPLIQHTGKICDKFEVKTGDSVLKGQLLATAEAKIYTPIHASISGRVSAIQDWPHPVLGQSKAIVIEGDGLDKSPEHQSIPQRRDTGAIPIAPGTRAPEEVKKLTPEQIREIVFKAGIVGLGGAAFPTHVKLNPPKPVHTLIINIAECEPYLTSDSQLVVEKINEILQGIELVAKCLDAKKIIIAIEDNKQEAIKTLDLALSSELLAHKNLTIELKVLKSQYPQGGEKQLIKKILNKEVPQGKLPFEIGVNVQNVATVYAIYEAVYKNKPLYERVVTVTGSILSHPKNVLARIGTPIKELINFCGPLKEEPAKIIVGGPMMGIAQYTDMVPVIKGTTGVILFNHKEAKIIEEEFCIRCGACVRECTAGLMPCLINLASEKGLWPEAKEYGALDCIECGLCNYVCPANRKLVQSIKRAKLELTK
jgi:electron transport complex protein RnfC